MIDIDRTHNIIRFQCIVAPSERMVTLATPIGGLGWAAAASSNRVGPNEEIFFRSTIFRTADLSLLRSKIQDFDRMAKRGRPSKEPSDSERAKVLEMVEEGASQRLIASALQRSIGNLRKFFSTELNVAQKIAGPRAPSFKITAAMREDVALMKACNETHRVIARAIGISEDDLVEFFADDLESGAARYRLKNLKRLDTLASKDHAGATNRLEALTRSNESGETTQASQGYIGKKVAAKTAAHEAAAAGGKFAPRSPPKLALVSGQGTAALGK